MLSCGRCGTSFSETRGTRLASCPRCRVRDGIAAPLVAAVPGTAGRTPSQARLPVRAAPETRPSWRMI